MKITLVLFVSPQLCVTIIASERIYIFIYFAGELFTLQGNLIITHYLLDRTNQMKPSDKKWCEDISMENG